MHDATEGGVDNALHELSVASQVGLDVERDRFPMGAGVRELCEYFEIDPWVSSSEGTVLLTVDPSGVDDVLDALSREGIRAAAVGEVTGTGAVVVDGDRIEIPDRDPFWPAYERARAEFGV